MLLIRRALEFGLSSFPAVFFCARAGPRSRSRPVFQSSATGRMGAFGEGGLREDHPRRKQDCFKDRADKIKKNKIVQAPLGCRPSSPPRPADKDTLRFQKIYGETHSKEKSCFKSYLI